MAVNETITNGPDRFGSDDWKDYAAMTFEPWQHTEGEWMPPTDAEWAKLANPHLITVRLAWATMFKTKSELQEGMRTMNDAARDLADHFCSTIGFFEGMLALLKGAEARLLCAGLSVPPDNAVPSEH